MTPADERAWLIARAWRPHRGSALDQFADTGIPTRAAIREVGVIADIRDEQVRGVRVNRVVHLALPVDRRGELVDTTRCFPAAHRDVEELAWLTQYMAEHLGYRRRHRPRAWGSSRASRWHQVMAQPRPAPYPPTRRHRFMARWQYSS